ncbi:hypothetical protein C8R46DRAFT_1060268, partial [Mycena filopes]
SPVMSTSYTNPRTGPPPPYHAGLRWGPPAGASSNVLHINHHPLPPVEQTPLLPQNVARKRSSVGATLALTLILYFSFLVVSRLCQAYEGHDAALDPATRDRIRREWNAEMRNHEKIRSAWGDELADHEAIRVGWEHERHEIIAMREQVVRDQERWMREREEERLEEERRKRAEEDRIRAGFSWEDLRGDEHCWEHGTRRYTARIANVPREYDPVGACAETAVEIHGIRIPGSNQCEDRGCNGVIGSWLVNHSEPVCATHFDNFKDKGCTSPGSGKRRIESHLENLHPGDDWPRMCSTTPANFRHLHFDSPGVCENWGKYGIWGIWEIEDDQC